MEGDLKMENRNYIMNGVGYTALLAAVIEQARVDEAKALKRGDMKEVADCEAGISEWADIAQSDINFNIYE